MSWFIEFPLISFFSRRYEFCTGNVTPICEWAESLMYRQPMCKPFTNMGVTTKPMKIRSAYRLSKKNMTGNSIDENSYAFGGGILISCNDMVEAASNFHTISRVFGNKIRCRRPSSINSGPFLSPRVGQMFQNVVRALDQKELRKTS